MRARRRLAGAAGVWLSGALGLGLGLAPAGAAPLAAPSDNGGASTQAGDAAEAWYNTSEAPLCSSPVGCPPVTLPTGSYPKDTLHVGVSSGIETSTTYLLPDLSAYLGGPLPTSGTMTLPVATVAGNGTTNPSAATIEACLSKALFKDGTQGATSPPPATDCSVHAGLSRNSSGSAFTLDLTPFLTAWAGGTPDYGIALVPDVTGAGPTTSWHVAFDGRNLVGAPHISSTLTPAATPSTSATAPDTPPLAPIGAPSVPAPGQPAGSTPVAAPSSPAAPVAASSSPPALAGVGAPTPPAGSTGSSAPATGPFVSSTSGGFQYPEILLLPLVLAAGVLAMMRMLTSDATPRRLRAR